ncbi:MAG: hypothetical protein NC301_03655 [Bacteroides sp.]|nr:hypothetical protein [Bacteroides sp.]MCM1378717.1 hypothetical protein [Bacteroides sp.]MCM1444990.1 hypothetical protein [Prevotella sp.]
MHHNQTLRSALKCVLLAAAIPSFANAETFTLDHTSLQTWIAPLKGISHQDTYEHNFSEGEISATFKAHFTSDNFNLGDFFSSTFTKYYQVRSDKSMNEFSFQSTSFKDKYIKSIIIDAFMYASTNENQQLIIDCGENKTFSKQIPLINAAVIRELDTPIDFQPIEVTIDTNIEDALTISFLSSGAELAFKSITIHYTDYVEQDAPEVTMSNTQVIGQQIILETNSDNAKIYYSLADDDNWTEYNPETRIFLSESGNYKLRYKATTADGTVESDIAEEYISVGAGSGFDAVRNAHQPITVNGIVLGQGNGYTIVGESTASSLDEAIAVENLNHSALQSAQNGTEVSATGLHTDKFGNSIPAIGSISALYLDGNSSNPTSVTAPTAAQSQSASYDLLGRQNIATTKRMIVIKDRKLQLQPGRRQ